MNYKEIFDKHLGKSNYNITFGKKLYIVLGLLADLDSFEYAQLLSRELIKWNQTSIKIYIIGIGDEQSKAKFCNFTGIPFDILHVYKDSTIHSELKLDSKSELAFNPILNLLLMCTGYKSPGTLREVMRGYVGDCTSQNIFKSKDRIVLYKNFSFNGSLFNLIGSENCLRPFELATRRLINMIEILSNWNIYVTDYNHICQRGGTFLLDEKDRLLYSYRNKNLLGYAEKMNQPFSFLDLFN